MFKRSYAFARVALLARAASQHTVRRVIPVNCRTSSALIVSTAHPHGRTIHSSRSLLKIIPFNLADIGEGIAEVEILKWHVKEGDTIAQFQPVCEVESDKATVPITSRYDGVIKKLYYEERGVAKVGHPLLDIEVPDASQPSSPVDATPPAATADPSVSKQAMDTIENNAQTEGKFLVTPAVRRLAREHAIPLHNVAASGKDGRIMKGDILDYLSGKRSVAAVSNVHTAETTISSPALPRPAAPAAPTVPLFAASTSSPAVSSRPPLSRADSTTRLSGVQRAMVKSMSAALQIPHFNFCDEVVMDKLHNLRNTLKRHAEGQGVRLSYMPFMIKAVSLALEQYPLLNSSLDKDMQNYVQHGSHNVSVAMDTPRGLIVPNIKNVQELSILDIAKELNRLQKAGQEGQLVESDLVGGTFALSNIGNIGGTYLSPVIMAPQVCIGAIGKIQQVPRFAPDMSVVPVRILNISWAADHRLVDGATMANFSNKWKSFLEDPDAMLLSMK